MNQQHEVAGRRRLLRPKQIQKKLSIGPTLFCRLVKEGKIKLYPLIGARASVGVEEEIDAFIGATIAAGPIKAAKGKKR